MYNPEIYKNLLAFYQASVGIEDYAAKLVLAQTDNDVKKVLREQNELKHKQVEARKQLEELLAEPVSEVCDELN